MFRRRSLSPAMTASGRGMQPAKNEAGAGQPLQEADDAVADGGTGARQHPDKEGRHQDHAALEAAAWGEVTVHDDVEAHHQQQREQQVGSGAQDEAGDADKLVLRLCARVSCTG